MEKTKTQPRELTGRAFDALPGAEKQRIFDEIENHTPQARRAGSRAPTAAEQARLNRVHKKLGRPKIGKGVKVISISVEADLLKQANIYAKHAGMKRTELFTQALRHFLRVRNAS